MIQGASYRLRQKKKAGLLGRSHETMTDVGFVASRSCRISVGARRRCRLALINYKHQIRRGSVLVSEGGQFLLSVDSFNRGLVYSPGMMSPDRQPLGLLP